MSFIGRLARENAWRSAYAERVLLEYKKFIYLCAVTQEKMMPSNIIDQAWHLHLAFTRSYWGVLCGSILKTELHHYPMASASEAEAYYKGYHSTLDMYRKAFGRHAPADIWPPTMECFNSFSEYVKVNLEQVWVIKKLLDLAAVYWPLSLLMLFFMALFGSLNSASFFIWLFISSAGYMLVSLVIMIGRKMWGNKQRPEVFLRRYFASNFLHESVKAKVMFWPKRVQAVALCSVLWECTISG